ncbi:zinc-dependent alcohol dehydrogenase [Aquiluna sp. Uisw_065]|uniref:zinc-dependent alcohol dehydrogenase n=1 Tax=Aquiluna sp. Uisw_065 TaxID=3230967 RepID=UPI0039ED6583
MTGNQALIHRRMLAVVKRAKGVQGIRLETVPVPLPGPGQAVIRVIATGICGTDIHIAHDEYAYELPVILGHEVLGTVSEVGSKEDQHWVGTKVAVETYFSACEKCKMCRDGRRNLCDARRSLGSFRDGGFAGFLLLPIINLHTMPETPGELDGVLSEPLACVTNCLMNPPKVQAGQSVLVLGAGAMGQLSAQVARALGGQVLLAGLPKDSERLAIARALGFQTTTDVPESNSFDVVIECSGSESGARVAFKAAKKGANYVQVGIFGKEVSVPFDTILLKELVVSSGFASTSESWFAAMDLIAQQKVSLSTLITNQVTLERFFEGLNAAEKGEGLKTVVLGSSS